MARKFSIDRLPKEVRDHIEKMVVDNRLTLAEMREQIATTFGIQHTPAQTPLWRFQQKHKRIVERLAESREVARGIVAEVGEKPDGDQGRAMVEVLSALVMKLLATAASRDDLDLEEIRHLARVVKQTAEAGTKALAQAKEIEAAARDRLLREQDAKLKSVVQEGGLSEAQAQVWRKKILGISDE